MVSIIVIVSVMVINGNGNVIVMVMGLGTQLPPIKKVFEIVNDYFQERNIKWVFKKWLALLVRNDTI